jgi:(1->4)-alpha-D-glucan 1-alpha-D-glucosylmutase
VARKKNERRALHWTVETDNGDRLSGDIGAEATKIQLPESLAVGDYRLKLFAATGGSPIAECLLSIAPPRAFLPAGLQAGERVWGFAVQLFALRSERNWGIGDFTDLLELIRLAADHGAGIIGLNPLHTLFPDQPERASPYSPSSRNFLNFIYIDPAALPEFDSCETALRLVADSKFREELATLRAASLVDYRRVAACKLRILTLLFRHFRERHLASGDGYGQEFRDFQRSGGVELRMLATFQALRQHFGKPSSVPQPWWQWPAKFRRPSAPAVVEFVREHETGIEFFEYQQWHAARQLRRCADQARKAGMRVGLYQDIAVGVDRDSAEAWSSPGYLVGDWSIGAPPDNWSALGQKWGTPPPHPRRMSETGSAAFRRCLRANMRAAGAVRIDHAIGLMRLFWIPAAAPATEGAFVLYPLEQLLAAIALESQVNRCLVVGEDLGTVPEGLQDALGAGGMLSYRLLYFERDAQGGFRRPGEWPAQALAAATTHDLPTLPGYWIGADIDLKERLGLYASPDMAERERNRRAEDRRELVAILRAEGLEADIECVPVQSLYRHLAKTFTKILMVQFEDLLGVTEQVNLPGTIDEHPNWRRKLPKTITEIFDDDQVIGTVAAIRAERGNAVAAAGGRP